MRAEGVQFYCPSSTYPAIVLLVLYFIDYNYRAIFDTSAPLGLLRSKKYFKKTLILAFEAKSVGSLNSTLAHCDCTS